MIRLRNILELITIVWKSKQKCYLLITSKGTNEFNTFVEAKRKGIELLRAGEVDRVRIALEITSIKSMVEIKK